jgi:hypothetical protein
MIGQHRKQLEPVGNHQEALVPSDPAQRHQDRNFPEANGAHVTRPRIIEREPFAGREPFRRDSPPENEMSIDQ